MQCAVLKDPAELLVACDEVERRCAGPISSGKTRRDRGAEKVSKLTC